jgi:hypothetical protein
MCAPEYVATRRGETRRKSGCVLVRYDRPRQ